MKSAFLLGSGKREQRKFISPFPSLWNWVFHTWMHIRKILLLSPLPDQLNHNFGGRSQAQVFYKMAYMTLMCSKSWEPQLQQNKNNYFRIKLIWGSFFVSESFKGGWNIIVCWYHHNLDHVQVTISVYHSRIIQIKRGCISVKPGTEKGIHGKTVTLEWSLQFSIDNIII